MWGNHKTRVYFDHCIWNRLVHKYSSEKEKEQKNRINRIIKYRNDESSILIFASEAVNAETYPLLNKNPDLREKLENKVKNISDGWLRTEYGEIKSKKFGRLGSMRLTTDEISEYKEDLIKEGFDKADAIHLATAITKQMDVFLTVDGKSIVSKWDNIQIKKAGLDILMPYKFEEELGID